MHVLHESARVHSEIAKSSGGSIKYVCLFLSLLCQQTHIIIISLGTHKFNNQSLSLILLPVPRRKNKQRGGGGGDERPRAANRNNRNICCAKKHKSRNGKSRKKIHKYKNKNLRYGCWVFFVVRANIISHYFAHCVSRARAAIY